MDKGHDPRSLHDWAQSLGEKLKRREDEYVLLQVGWRSSHADNEQCRVLALKSATSAMIELINSLQVLPQFQGNVGLTPLLDIAAGLHDLTIGGRPRMLERAAGVGVGRDGASKFYVKHAAIAVLLFIRAGLTEVAARKRVATELSALGFTGRKGGPLSPGTLFDWVEECRATEAWSSMNKFVADWAEDEAEMLSQESILRWIQQVGKSPQMQSRI